MLVVTDEVLEPRVKILYIGIMHCLVPSFVPLFLFVAARLILFKFDRLVEVLVCRDHLLHVLFFTCTAARFQYLHSPVLNVSLLMVTQLSVVRLVLHP